MEGWPHRVVGSNKLVTLNEDHNAISVERVIEMSRNLPVMGPQK